MSVSSFVAIAVQNRVVVELDEKGLGRLRRMANAREVWQTEAGDFTPWLAANLDVLAEALGMTLTLISTEVSVGDFRLDVHAEDDSGRTVIIENQLERTDHGHLGQCLLYASGLEASTVVWIAPSFRDEFRRTFDWLNERTDLGVNFFGVEIGVVQIGDSGPHAPVFDVVSRPNDWQKSVKGGTAAPTSANAVVSSANAARQDYFQEVLTIVNQKNPAIRIPARGRGNWVSFGSAPFGNWDLSVSKTGDLRIEAYLDMGDKTLTKALFDEFTANAADWDQQTGAKITWERLDDARASRVAVYQPFDPTDETGRAVSVATAADTLLRMHAVLNEPLRTRAIAIRKAAAQASDLVDTGPPNSGLEPVNQFLDTATDDSMPAAVELL